MRRTLLYSTNCAGQRDNARNTEKSRENKGAAGRVTSDGYLRRISGLAVSMSNPTLITQAGQTITRVRTDFTLDPRYVESAGNLAR